jgi:hypothetical protein
MANELYSNFYENVTFLRNLVKFCEFLNKRIMDRNFILEKQRKNVEKQHISTKNDDAEFEKEVFLHNELVMTKK